MRVDDGVSGGQAGTFAVLTRAGSVKLFHLREDVHRHIGFLGQFYAWHGGHRCCLVKEVSLPIAGPHCDLGIGRRGPIIGATSGAWL